MIGETPMPKKNTRWLKILRLSQAHLAPGMSLHRWQTILAAHGLLLPSPGRRGEGGKVDPWPTVTDATLDALVAEISAIVRQEINHA